MQTVSTRSRPLDSASQRSCMTTSWYSNPASFAQFNDDEEKAYKKEAYGDDSEEAEEDGEEESSFDPPAVVPLAKDFSKRANRGNRMAALVERAVDEEEEDDFWGGVGKDFFGVAAEGEEEPEEASKSFVEGDISDKSAAIDSFDSDFGRDDEDSAE